MRLIEHSISNYKGIITFTMRPGAITLISGANGTGKTSVLDSFRSMADGGKEADSINKDAEEAYIKSQWEVVTGDSEKYGPGSYTMERKITPTSYTFSVKGPDGKKLPSPAEFRDWCLPAAGYDPLAFDLLSDEERAEKLRKVLLVPVKAADIRARIGKAPMPVMDKDVYEDGIGQIEAVDKDLREKRKTLNALIDDRKGSIATFEEMLAGKSVESVEAELAAAKKEVERAQDAVQSQIIDIDREQFKMREDAGAAFSGLVQAADAWYHEQASVLAKERDARKTDAQAAMIRAKDDAAALKEARTAELQPTRDALAAAKGMVTTLELKQDEAQKLDGARAQVDNWRTELQAKQGHKDALELALRGLDQFRTKVMEQVKVEGIDIKGGRLFIDGVLSSEVNTARRWMKWVEVAAMFLSAGQPLIIDNMETLDAANRATFEGILRDAAIPVIAAMVSDGPLEIKESLT